MIKKKNTDWTCVILLNLYLEGDFLYEQMYILKWEWLVMNKTSKLNSVEVEGKSSNTN